MLSGVAAVLALGALPLAAQQDPDSDTFMVLVRQGLTDTRPRVREKTLEIVSPILWSNKYLMIGENGGWIDYKVKYGPSLVKAVLPLIDDPSPQIRAMVLMDVGGYYRDAGHRPPDVEVRDRIAGRLKDTDAGVRREAITALGWTGAKERAGEIAEFLKDGDPATRSEAIRALKQLGAKEQVDKIAELMNDPDADVRARAIEAAAGLDGKNRIEQIAKHLDDQDPHVRIMAMWNIVALADSEAYLERVAMLLKDADPTVRVATILALGGHSQSPQNIMKNPKEYACKIAALLDDEDPEVRSAAEGAVKAMSGWGGWDIWCKTSLWGVRIPLPLKRAIAGLLKKKVEQAAATANASGTQSAAKQPEIGGVLKAMEGFNGTKANATEPRK